jgi:hypothetical protein
MDAWLNPEAQATEGTVNAIVEDDAPPFATAPAPSTAKASTASPSAKASKANTDDVTAAFDNLFNS